MHLTCYQALSQYGENYELIAYVLPGRDRKSCKNKFKVEDKRNLARINHCLNNSIPVGEMVVLVNHQIFIIYMSK